MEATPPVPINSPAGNADYPDLLFLAAKSQDLINKQVESYRHHQSNSATVLTLLAVFLPFFLNGLSDSALPIKYASVLPTALIVAAILILLQIFRSQPLDQSFAHTEFLSLINESYEQILLFEIGANTQSFAANSPITARANAQYNRALLLTVIAVILSAGLLMADKFVDSPKQVQEVHLTNLTNMNRPETAARPTTPAPRPIRVLPNVPPERRERLNEGVERDNNRNTPARPNNP